jgi:hypothetical protein
MQEEVTTTSWHGGTHDSLFERIQAQRQAREQEMRAKEASFREAMEVRDTACCMHAMFMAMDTVSWPLPWP